MKADADAWASETERSLQKGLIQPVSLDQNATLADLLKRYGQEITTNKRGKAVEGYRLSKIGRHQISAIPLSRLKSFHLIDYRNQRLDEVSSTTVRKELALIAHVLKIGEIEWGYHFLSNLMDPVRKPSENPQRMRRLQPGEERLLLSSCRTSQNRWLSSVVLMAIETAMRRGELLGLEWAKIDLVNRTAHLPMTKNGSGRTVPLSTTAVETLQSLPRDITGKAFPISRTALRGLWNRACQRANIEDLNFHDLRHEATSRFFEKGLNVIEVASITGHKDPSMLMRYTHLRAEDLAVKLG